MILRSAPLSVLILTLVLGFSVGVTWMAFGRVAYQGAVERAVAASGVLIYGLVATLAATTVYVLTRRRPVLGLPVVAALAIGAWLGELVAMTLFGRVLANELNPLNGWYFWLWATGGPLQPAAAFLGGWLAARLRMKRLISGR